MAKEIKKAQEAISAVREASRGPVLTPEVTERSIHEREATGRHGRESLELMDKAIIELRKTLQALAAQYQELQGEDAPDFLVALPASTIEIGEPTPRSWSSWLASSGDDFMLPGHGQADERQDDEGHREEKAAEPAND